MVPESRFVFDGSRPVLEMAPMLLGAYVEHAGVGVRIVEVEAYDGANDPGAHGFRGQTPRNAVMFGPPGHLYVYFTYGMHYCINVVCGESGRAAGALLRAGEVVHGIELARSRRGTSTDRDLARGPARLAQAMAFVDLSRNGTDLADPTSPVVVRPHEDVEPQHIRTGPRVGVSGPGGNGERFPWRFWIEGDRHVSIYRPAVRRKRP
ncbi:MAG: DNA-3-methyladenine glycosylase [Allobranchiibius sp.]